MDLTQPEWGESDALQFFGRHLLAIRVAYRLADAPKDSALSFAAYNGALVVARPTPADMDIDRSSPFWSGLRVYGIV